MAYLPMFVSELAYEHKPDNVIHLNTSHARANAAQAAMLLEDNRRAVREDLKIDLLRRRRDHEEQIAGIDAALMELAGG